MSSKTSTGDDDDVFDPEKAALVDRVEAHLLDSIDEHGHGEQAEIQKSAAFSKLNNYRITNMRTPVTRSFAATLALLLIMSVNAAPANAVVYCKSVGVPKGCVVKPGVVLTPAPAVGVATTPAVGTPGVNTPTNKGGPVNRVGRR